MTKKRELVGQILSNFKLRPFFKEFATDMKPKGAESKLTELPLNSQEVGEMKNSSREAKNLSQLDFQQLIINHIN